MLRNRFLPIIVAAASACAIPRLGRAQPNPCPPASALALKQVDALRSALTSSDSSAVYYAQVMGVAGLSQADLVIETNAAVCTAVTEAIQSYLRGDPPTSNYLVIRAGSRYIAIEPDGMSNSLYTVTNTYQDVRSSG